MSTETLEFTTPGQEANTPDSAENGTTNETQTLKNSVERALQTYFDQLDGQDVTGLYDLVLAEVEVPLLETVMKYTRDNQTKASQVLGLNRGTLRKKLKQYGML